MRFARPLLNVLLAVALVLLLGGVAAACPTCKNAIAENDPQHARMAAGYFYSILFMMSMPFVLLGSFSTYMYVEVRRARAKQAGPQAESDESR